MIQRIFLDLDDVCNTLAMYVLHVRGIDISQTNYAEYPVACGYDIVAAANSLGARCTQRNFWRSITQKQWALMPLSDFFPWLLKTCAHLVGRKNIYIVTASIDIPTQAPDYMVGKLEWIYAHFPLWMHQQYVITRHKYLLAQPDTLLIDDHPGHIDAFIKSGGQGLLVPRPWNVHAGCDAKTHLERHLEAGIKPCPYGIKRTGCRTTGPWCGYCRAENSLVQQPSYVV